ncbi:imelysin family protein [Biformimicrobium ophioploci]|uniref:Imelysin-like domain-containing protein n=1 Tax=Biformimicrobium ophioploci TaxID=3036711 RepID=A0ABQ6M0I3_9GAMM|nr:imelysin family protein [Microbulbifer sp. NKW57]GMG87851.1 hypothetical protein MNKW57_21720 [Microbulbifer sp. NKW57]
MQIRYFSTLVGVSLALVACSADRPDGRDRAVQGDAGAAAVAVDPVDPPARDAAGQAQALALWGRGQAALENAGTAAAVLQSAVESMLEQPDAARLDAVRNAWEKSHEAYMRALPWLRLAFAAPEHALEGRAMLLQIDSWPVVPGYLDRVPGYPASGLVHDTALELTSGSLRKQHRLTADEEASLGFHVLELLLWGATGERRAADFVAGSGGEAPQQAPAARRRLLVQLVAGALAQDFERLGKRWPPLANDLSRPFLALDERARLARVRSSGVALLEQEFIARLPQSSESDVESPVATGTLVALVAMLDGLRDIWFGGGAEAPSLLLETHRQEALQAGLNALGEKLASLQSPIELEPVAQLNETRQLANQVAGILRGDPLEVGSGAPQ